MIKNKIWRVYQSKNKRDFLYESDRIKDVENYIGCNNNRISVEMHNNENGKIYLNGYFVHRIQPYLILKVGKKILFLDSFEEASEYIGVSVGKAKKISEKIEEGEYFFADKHFEYVNQLHFLSYEEEKKYQLQERIIDGRPKYEKGKTKAEHDIIRFSGFSQKQIEIINIIEAEIKKGNYQIGINLPHGLNSMIHTFFFRNGYYLEYSHSCRLLSVVDTNNF